MGQAGRGRLRRQAGDRASAERWRAPASCERERSLRARRRLTAMDRLEFLKAQPWLDEVAGDEWPAGGELFAGTCVLELVGDVGTSPPRAAALPLWPARSSTQTGVPRAATLGNAGRGGGRAPARARARRRRAAGGAGAWCAPARGVRGVGPHVRRAPAPHADPADDRQFGGGVRATTCRTSASSSTTWRSCCARCRGSLTAAAEQLRRTMACMLRELPRGPAELPLRRGRGRRRRRRRIAAAAALRRRAGAGFGRARRELAGVCPRAAPRRAGARTRRRRGAGRRRRRRRRWWGGFRRGRRRAGHRRSAGQRAAAAARRGARAAVGDARRRGAAAPGGL